MRLSYSRIVTFIGTTNIRYLFIRQGGFSKANSRRGPFPRAALISVRWPDSVFYYSTAFTELFRSIRLNRVTGRSTMQAVDGRLSVIIADS